MKFENTAQLLAERYNNFYYKNNLIDFNRLLHFDRQALTYTH